MGEINPGSDPVDGGRLDLAEQLLPLFEAEVRERAELGDPVRVPESDVDGRFGWRIPTQHGEVLLLVPGVDEVTVKSHAVSAPCLRVGDAWWWWNSAVMAAANASLGKP